MPYNGERTAKAIVTHATQNMPTFVKRASSPAELAALRSQASAGTQPRPVALLFTSAALVTPLYKALSSDLHKSIDFYAARDAKVGEEAMREFGVDKVPGLVVVTAEGVEKYEGALKFEEIKAWLKPIGERAGKKRDEL